MKLFAILNSTASFFERKSGVNWKIASSFGFLLGVLWIFSRGSFVTIVLTVLIMFLLSLIANEDERLFLKRIFIWGLALRLCLTLLMQFIFMLLNRWSFLDSSVKATTIFGDEELNTVVSWWYAQYAAGVHLSSFSEAVVLTGTIGDYGRSGYLYLVALFYYLFGYSPMSVTFINCILGVSTGIVYYFIARDITGVKPAKITAFLVVFMPSLVIWSALNLKDTLFIFLTALVLWISLKFLETFKLKYLIFLTALLLFQSTLRAWVIAPTFLALGICWFFTRKRFQASWLWILVIATAGILPIFSKKITDLKGSIINYHLGTVFTGGNIYRIYDDWVYRLIIPTKMVSFGQVLKGLIKGWVHFLFEPFPWKLFSGLKLLFLPQMFFWYLSLLFCLLGTFLQLRYNFRKSLLFLVYLFIMGSILAFTGGNIGTNIRFRDALAPVVFIFSSVVFARIFNRSGKGLSS